MDNNNSSIEERIRKYELTIQLVRERFAENLTKIENITQKKIELTEQYDQITKEQLELRLLKEDAERRLYSLQHPGLEVGVPSVSLEKVRKVFRFHGKKHKGQVEMDVYDYAISLPVGQCLSPRELIDRYGVGRGMASDFLMYLTEKGIYERKWKGKYVRLSLIEKEDKNPPADVEEIPIKP